MSTMEHLFMQIFERKGWIQTQLCQQAESYVQSLASNLLADGYRPPHWLWPSGLESHAGIDPKEMNREQLISEILFPPARFTAPSVNHSSLFALPSLSGGQLLQSSNFSVEASALDKAVPKNYCVDSKRGSGDMVGSKATEVSSRVDPLSRIKHSRPTQVDFEARVQKKQRTTKVSGDTENVDGFTGKMTRSMAASLKLDRLKNAVETKNLSSVNIDGCRVTRSQARKLESLNLSSKPAKPLACMEDGIDVAAKAQIDHCIGSSVVEENLELQNASHHVSSQICAAGTRVNAHVICRASPVQTHFETVNAGVSQQSEFKSLVEPKQLLFDGIDVYHLHTDSANASKRRSEGIPDEMDIAKLESLQSASVQLHLEDSEIGFDASAKRKFQEVNLFHADESMCQADGCPRVSHKSPEVERLDFDDSGCASLPLPRKCELSPLCGSSSKAKLNSVNNSSDLVNDVQDAFVQNLQRSMLQCVTGEQQKAIEVRSSEVALPESDFLQSVKGSLAGQDSRANNFSSTAGLYEKKLFHYEEMVQTLTGGENAANGESEAGFDLIVDDSEDDSGLTSGHLEDSQVASRVSLEILGQCTREVHCSGSIICSKTLEINVAVQPSEVIKFGNLQMEKGENSYEVVPEPVLVGKENRKCETLEETDVLAANAQLLEEDPLRSTKVKSSLKEVKSFSHSCKQYDFPDVDISNETVSTSLEDCKLNSRTDFSDHAMVQVVDDKKGIPLQSSMQKVEECIGIVAKQTADDIVQQYINISLTGASLFETHQVLIEADPLAAVEESKVAQSTISPAGTEAQNTNLDFMEKQIPVHTPNSCEVSYALPETHSLSTSSVNVDNNIDYCKTSGSFMLCCNEYCMERDVAKGGVIWDSPTAHDTESQNAPPQPLYFLRSLTRHAGNYASFKSSDMNTASSSERPLEAICNACESTWPKRRKIDRAENIHASTIKMRFKPLLSLQEGCEQICKSTANAASEPAMDLQPFHVSSETGSEISVAVSESFDKELHQSKKRCKIEDGTCSKRRDQFLATTSPGKCQPGVYYFEESNREFRSSAKDDKQVTGSPILDLAEIHISEDGQVVNIAQHEMPKKTANYEKSSKDRSMHDGNQLFSRDSVRLSLYDDDQIHCDEAMPEFEGFSIGVPSIKEDEIIFNDSDFAYLAENRASLLEQLCQSSNIITPSSRPPTKYKIHEVPDIYQSLPNGLLEHMGNKSLELNGISIKQMSASADGSLTSLYSNLEPKSNTPWLGRPHAHNTPSLSARFGSGARKPPLTPPVGKINQRILGRSCASSEKLGSSAELICFRIDENSCTTEENGQLSEIENSFEKKVGSRGSKASSNRKALADVTSHYQNTLSLFSESKNPFERGNLDSEIKESHHGAQMHMHPSVENDFAVDGMSKVEDKENRFLSGDGNEICKVAESLCRVSGKPVISAKGKEMLRSHNILGKGGKPSNILSNISSFIPLVRQKQQEAAPAAGKKRDIKVKALEVAEAAKRLEEQKRSEREMRKAAAKLERERLEQEKARKLVLQEKQKEEARKIKEANAAKKRQRADGERKEKERKKMCIQETKKQQRQGGEKLCVGKEEKRLQKKTAVEKEPRIKELVEEGKGQLDQENHRKVADCLKATAEVVGPSSSEVVAVDEIPDHSRLEAHDSSREPNDTTKMYYESQDLQKTIQDRMSFTKGSLDLQSYEISPYKDSDDEDDEEDIKRKKKHIPLWARKESLARILLSNQQINPVEIFSRKNSFNLSEVLSPRIIRRPLSQLR